MVFGASTAKVLDHDQTIFARQLRQNRRDTGAVHLAVDLLGEVLVRRVREDPTTATPQRRGSHTGTSTARTLLAERLLGAVMDFGTGQLGAVTGAAVGLIGNDDLMHQRFVEVATEQGIGCSNGRCLLALIID